jgi:hypothetical protein
MTSKTKVLGGCYIIVAILLGVVFAVAFGSISANFGGNFEEAFWTAMPGTMIIGLIVAACIVAFASAYME